MLPSLINRPRMQTNARIEMRPYGPTAQIRQFSKVAPAHYTSLR